MLDIGLLLVYTTVYKLINKPARPKDRMMKLFSDSTEMAKAYAAENGIKLLSAISFIKDVSDSYFEAATGIKAHKPVMFYISNYGYVGESESDN